MFSSNHLVECCVCDELPSLIPTLDDYFGKYINDPENFIIIFGIYQCLVKFKGVDKKLLHKCYLANRLDDLINIKFKHAPTGYYKKYINNKIIIGNTNLLSKKDNTFVINDDSYCPDCETQCGYLEYMMCTKE